MLAGLITLGIVWVIIGFVLMLMAGLTYKFADRHFPEVFMLVLGPLGWPVWLWCEKREAKRNKG